MDANLNGLYVRGSKCLVSQTEAELVSRALFAWFKLVHRSKRLWAMKAVLISKMRVRATSNALQVWLLHAEARRILRLREMEVMALRESRRTSVVQRRVLEGLKM